MELPPDGIILYTRRQRSKIVTGQIKTHVYQENHQFVVPMICNIVFKRTYSSINIFLARCKDSIVKIIILKLTTIKHLE